MVNVFNYAKVKFREDGFIETEDIDLVRAWTLT